MMIRDYEVVDGEQGFIREIKPLKPTPLLNKPPFTLEQVKEIMSIKDNIKEELLKLIKIEEQHLLQRHICATSVGEYREIHSEQHFLEKLKKFAESI